MQDKNVEAVQARRRAIADEIERLTQEDGELAVAEKVLQRLSNEQFMPPAKALERRPAATRPRTQRELVLWALEASPKLWLWSSDIVDDVRSKWGITLPERSARPLLTLMKREGEIVRNGREVASKARVREESAGTHSKDSSR